MIFWLLLTALTLSMLTWVVWPLFRVHGRERSRAEYDADIYYDQLQELKRDRARGLIDETQADAARGEIERRLLAAGRAAELGGRPGARRQIPLAFALILLVPLGSVPMYLGLGSPGLPGQPFATREAPAAADGVVVARERLREAEARTTATPNEAQPWLELGRLRLVVGDVDGAETALARARELAPRRGEIASAHGEALVRLTDGIVTPAARAAFTASLAENKADPRARYFLGLADYQAGREQDALYAWAALAGDAPPNAPWLPTVIARVTETARKLGHDPADWLLYSAPTTRTRGPTVAEIAAAEDMNDAERREMIRGMVDGLAARLEDEPDNLAGWRMLARSWEMLNDPTAAATAYARAIALEPNHPETLFRGAITAADSGDTETARRRFTRLRDLIPPGTEAHRMVTEAISRLDADAPAR
ncbi:MAG: c-type cytochrome biogenesis protein CcmI [Rhodospirillaceae bacterium]|nr:c-type cytochrome biogenesis protein CcmI [Rhodospirillaceae bacterium]